MQHDHHQAPTQQHQQTHNTPQNKPTAKRRNPPNPNPITQTSKPHTETHAQNTNPPSPKHKSKTQASSKNKTKTPKIKNRGRNGLGRWPNVGRRRRVCGGWARADQQWVSEEERRVCGSMEEERRDGEAVRRERQRKDNEGKNKK